MVSVALGIAAAAWFNDVGVPGLVSAGVQDSRHVAHFVMFFGVFVSLAKAIRKEEEKVSQNIACCLAKYLRSPPLTKKTCEKYSAFLSFVYVFVESW